MKPKICYVIAGFFLISGCASIPPREFYSPPSDLLQNAVDESPDQIFDKDQNLKIDWWALFEDEQLNGFILTALKKNPSLQIAEAELMAAYASADIDKAALMPSVSFQGDISRWRLSKTGIFNAVQPPAIPGIQAQGIPLSYWQPEMSINFRQILDFWGKYRAIFQAALGDARAYEAEAASASLEISIAVAQTYFQLQINQGRLRLFKQLIENRQKTVNLVEQLIKNHLDQEISLLKIQSDLEAAKQQLFQIELDAALSRNQLRSLLGNALSEDEPVEIEERVIPAIPLPEDLPLHLVGLRPDVVAMRLRAEANAMRIQAAYADFFPDINLVGYLGLQTIHPRVWLKRDSIYGQAGPALNLPLFDGGLRSGRLALSQQDYIIAVEEYNQTVLRSVQEVLNGIAAVHKRDEQLISAEQLALKAKSIFKLTAEREKNRLASLIDSLNAEKESLIERDRHLQAEGAKLQSMLMLIKSLGGGYREAQNDCT